MGYLWTPFKPIWTPYGLLSCYPGQPLEPMSYPRATHRLLMDYPWNTHGLLMGYSRVTIATHELPMVPWGQRMGCDTHWRPLETLGCPWATQG